MSERKTCDLKSYCTACGKRDVLRYKGGVERHTCKACGNVWTKTPQSTRAALPWAKHLAARGIKA